MSRPSFDRAYLAGQLLIAMPNMGDPRFERSVVLMCSHGEDHAMGVVINKRIDGATLGDLIEQLEISSERDLSRTPVHYGGPVQTDRGLVVHTLDYQCRQTLVVTPEIGVTGSRDILVDIAERRGGSIGPSPSRFFLALGHAGWSGGQLEDEIAMNAWAHGEANADIVFAGATADPWTMSLEAIGVTGAMLSPEWSTPRRDDQPLN